MPIEWSHSIDSIDWNELSDLYLAAPLGNKKPAELKTAFSNSMFRCFARDAGKIVAAGRALADGSDCSYISDIAVLPSYQGQGVGKQLVARLIDLSCGHKKIILYAVPGKELFYRKLGFKPMATAMAIFQDEAHAFERGFLREG